MARQPRTRQPKKKYSDSKVKCWCGAEKMLYQTKSGAAWQCTGNITH